MEASHSILFTIEDRPGALEEALAVFKAHEISLQHIESRPSKSSHSEYDFMVEFHLAEADHLEQLTQALEAVSKRMTVITHEGRSGTPSAAPSGRASAAPAAKGAGPVQLVPWFPRKLKDLDGYASKTLEYGAELSADHPGFTDAEYRRRRAEITAIAQTYRSGQPIPRIEYTEQEVATWTAVYTQLTRLYPTHACKEHQYAFPLLVQNCGYGPERIPQLQDVSDFLRECTGFTLRPVMGLLSSRDFLNGLAFRVFHSTQYIRHHSNPLYTPEPDVCHELLGHVPLFADPSFAAFSQEIGLCSLGASEEDIKRLATIYWFTVEFGLCKQDGMLRAYGAGLLSSVGELQYCLSDEPAVRAFEPSQTALQTYPITNYQPLYYVAESFRDAQIRVREFAATMDRPFSVRYDPYTQTIQVLDSREKILNFAANISHDMGVLTDALQKLNAL